MYEAIDTQPGGKTIGLEGSWGAGKSTIIRLLSKTITQASNSPPFLIFNFDAWAHQGDPLRRAFLEGLIDHCLAKHWIGDGASSKKDSTKEWEDEKGKLARRIKESKKETMPVLTSIGRILLPLLLLLPLGMSLISGGLNKAPVSWLVLIIGLVILASPGCVLFWFWRKAKGNANDQQRLLTMFYQKASTEELTKTIETSEPTTLEFQNVFSRLLTNALSEDDRRMIIVLDNLDRISSSESAGIWAMLRSFIDNPQFSKEPWFIQLWVVIPYAPLGLAVDKDDQRNRSAQSQEQFLEKVIQVKFYVPPPVLSNWKTYLNELLGSAFPQAKESASFYRIYLLFADELSVDSPPGPRELVTLINDIVATDLQWQGIIPLEHQALFAVLKRNGREISKELIKRTLPTGKQISILGPDVGGSLAALTFNLDVDSANQILLIPRLKEVLTDGLGKELAEEYRTRRGFSEILEVNFGSVIREDMPHSLSYVLRIIVSLFKSNILKEAKFESQQEILQQIGLVIGELPYWPLNEELLPAALDAFVQLDSARQFRVTFQKSLHRTSKWFDDITNKLELGDELAKYKPILKTISDIRNSCEIKDYFDETWSIPEVTILCDDRFWIELCSYMWGQDNLVLDSVGPSRGDENIFEYMKDEIGFGRFSFSIYQTLLRYIKVEKTKYLSKVIDLVLTRISATTSISTQEIYLSYSLLSTVSHVDATFKDGLAKNINDGWILHFLYQTFVAERQDRVSSVLIAIWLNENPAAESPAAVGNSVPGYAAVSEFLRSPSTRPELLSTLCEFLDSQNGRESIFQIAWSKGVAYPLAVELIVQLTNEENISLVLNGSDLVRKAIFILYSFKAAGKDSLLVWNFLGEEIGRADVIEKIVSTPLTDKHLDFYESLIENTLIGKNELFVKWCRTSLIGVSREDFATDLMSFGPWTKLILKLSTSPIPLKLGTQFRDALKDVAIALQKGESVSSETVTAANELFDAIEPALMSGFTDELYELTARAAQGALSENFFSFIGDLLARHRVLAVASNKAIRRLIIPLVEQLCLPGLEWLSRALAQDSSILTGGDGAAIQDLFEKLQLSLKEAPEVDVINKLYAQLLSSHPEFLLGDKN
ncbi:hypothetical protein DZB54_20390 [Herbaspirillum sp. 3R-3a1]|nr:hypothetical protein DZB54_20390 [Herbaspirillum sp. 3R-3a1]